jgi:uncharacterized membrane protein YfcA
MIVTALCFFAFLAGLLDAMVGGGGLVQLPALLVCLPATPPGFIFGTSKLAALVGTSVAVVQYAKAVAIPWRSIGVGALTALAGAFLGARTVSILDPAILKPLVLVLIVGMLVYIAVRRDFGGVERAHITERQRQLRTAILGAVIGFYDGFFGPGTGTFFIMGLIAWCGFDFLRASGAARLLNVGTNLSAVAYFAFNGQVLYEIAIPMAVANAAGGFLGSRFAIAKGSRFVRVVFLMVASGLALRLAWDLIRNGW